MARRAKLRCVIWAGGALVVMAAILAGPAAGERSQFGDVIVSLDGSISPRRLPRDHLGPVFVHLEGRLATADGSSLPRVSRIELGLAGPGVLSTSGLPACGLQRLRATDTRTALRLCGDALVGWGRLTAQVVAGDQPPFVVTSKVLAFNGRIRGLGQTVLMQAFATDPPISIVIPFLVRHPRKGNLGTVLVGNLPKSIGTWPRFASFDLTFGRHYVYRGLPHSYLRASCPLPRRFTAGFLPFARASYLLEDGRRLTRDIVRSCRARPYSPR